MPFKPFQHRYVIHITNISYTILHSVSPRRSQDVTWTEVFDFLWNRQGNNLYYIKLYQKGPEALDQQCNKVTVLKLSYGIAE